MNSQYGITGNVSWESFASNLSDFVANRAARTGALAAVAAARNAGAAVAPEAVFD